MTLRVVRPGLFVEEALSRTVEVLIRDRQRQTILFRSKPILITLDRAVESIRLAVISGVAAPRGATLRIEVRDCRTEEVLDAKDSILRVTLEEW